MYLDRSRDRLGAWLDGLRMRMHPNKVVVALAAKMVRVASVILNRPGALYERRDPAFACRRRLAVARLEGMMTKQPIGVP